MQCVLDLNTVKKGTAELDLDAELVLAALQKITQVKPETPVACTLDLPVCFYAVLHLLVHPEFSMRETAELALRSLLACNPSSSLFRLIEGKLMAYLRSVRDEMTLRTVLTAIRTIVLYAKQHEEKTASCDLAPLLG